MKKTMKKIMIPALVISSFSLLSGCNKNTGNEEKPTEDITLVSSSLSIKTEVTKKEYFVDEKFDSTGLVVEKSSTYSDKSVKTEEYTNFELSITDGTTLDKTYLEELNEKDITVNVSAKDSGITATSFTINLKNLAYFLSLTTENAKNSYTVGDTLDLTNIKVFKSDLVGNDTETTEVSEYSVYLNDVEVNEEYVFTSSDVGSQNLVFKISEEKYSSVSFAIIVSEKADTRLNLTLPEIEGVTYLEYEGNGLSQSGVYKFEANEEVSLYIDPVSNYEINSVTLKFGENSEVLQGSSLNLYTFSMPEVDASLVIDVAKSQNVTVTFNKPSITYAISSYMYLMNGTEQKQLSTVATVPVGSTIKIQITPMSGKTVKTIVISDGTIPTKLSSNIYTFVVGESDITVSVEFEEESSEGYSISIPSSNDYELYTLTGNGSVIFANNRVATSGTTIYGEFYTTSSSTFSKVTVTNSSGEEVSCTYNNVTIDDYDDYDREVTYNGIEFTFTMPSSNVTIVATLN